ncbi:hypothetical protein ASD65_14745 [Microbacterium sp. Root61]|uniref:hypothetical protein n=1 Tax=Microbacterium sp. Root61 TaxID=1736570 RepID=UPI0006F4BB84|nr:hypothetical protein [Microbacterium sp. Root61]KRA25536.1 hypothetical protein ASD65_14745 [Microbacterium sp. Root61]
MSEPQKRPAFEPPTRLMKPMAYDPAMRRPISTVAGAVLVLLRVLAGAVWLIELAAHWGSYAAEIDGALEGVEFSPGFVDGTLAVFVGISILVLLVDASLAVLIIRGVNWARVVVMIFSVISITSSFVGWWVQGQEIELRGSLLSLALDILVLLALSSRSAAAYARRNERR